MSRAPAPPSASVAPNRQAGHLARLKPLIDYSTIQAVPEIWPVLAQRNQTAHVVALHDPHATSEVLIPYLELYQYMQQFAAGLQALGVASGDRIALFSDNSPRWMIADQGSMMAGAVDVVRSSQADREELLYILEHSGSTFLIVENAETLAKLRDRLDNLPIPTVVLLSDQNVAEGGDRLKILNFNQLMQMGAGRQPEPVLLKRDSLATLLYTSGTTGKPKGVMLSHGNLLHQINAMGLVVQPQPGDRVLSLLPSWHAYERTVEYFLLSQGCTQTYTSLRHVKQDLRQYRPHFMVGVPRLWESIYEGVQKQFREQPEKKQKLVYTLLNNSQRYVIARHLYQNLHLNQLNPPPLKRFAAGAEALIRWPIHLLGRKLVYSKVKEATGGQVKQLISGGGSLAMHLDSFFEIIGVQLLVGYGLTETSPVLTVRRCWRNLLGSAGQPMMDTEIRIVDPETHAPLPQGQRGLVLARGPQVMQGYYRNPEATAKAIDPDGWFNTGDLGWVTDQNDLVLTGREKDTIVLTNGENIEPQPIEDACVRSAYIDQIMLVGQDQRTIGALIVPNLEALEKWAATQNLHLQVPNPSIPPAPGSQSIDLDSRPVQELFRQELNREVRNRPGYRADDRIGPFRLILEPFSMDNGMMTQTLKVRRPVVMERYRGMIDGMFS